MIELFWSSGSCPAWRVLLALELKRIPYESRLLQLSKLEHKTDEMLAMNPRGTLPVLRNGDFSLYEGFAIMTYLDRQYPERPLLGSTSETAGRIARGVMEVLFHLEPAADAVVIPIYRGKTQERADTVRRAAQTLHEELARLEARLSESAWLAGDEISGADVTAAPQLGHVSRALAKPEAESLDLGVFPLDARYPRLADWWQRVQAWPEYDRTYPPHWR